MRSLKMIQRTLWVENSSGQAAVEFTLTIILFVLLMYGIVEGSRAMFAYSSASQASREGVRYASVRGAASKQNVPTCTDCPATVAQISSWVRNKAPGVHLQTVTVCWFKKNPSTVCASTPHLPDNQEPGSNVRVTVSVNFRPVLPLPLIPPVVIPISSMSEMLISN
jgi:Flp pilus assembly protein TadG